MIAKNWGTVLIAKTGELTCENSSQFFLDLTGPPPADMEKKMSQSKASTTLKVVKGDKESENNTLPEDLRYSLDTLRRLFLRPRTRVTLRQVRILKSEIPIKLLM